MQIIHRIDDFLQTIFPNIDDDNLIISVLEDFYTYGPYKPKVKIEKGFVIVDIDITAISNQEIDFRKVISFCENSRFSEAKPLLLKLIDNNPTISEYHRILGQILSDEGEVEDAINSLIYALRWDSKNSYALIMMGNIFAKEKDDIETALKYYNQALIINPKDNITINNIGANLLQQNKFEEAKKYFYKALKLNDKYPNTHYALAIIAESEGDFHSAFCSFIQTLKCSKETDFLYKTSFQSINEIVNKIFQTDSGKNIFRKYRVILEQKGGVEIDIVKDETIATLAKIELAENYDREKHIVKFKDTSPYYPHLIMHELVHLDFILDAKKEETNLLFVSSQQHKLRFIKSFEASLKKLNKLGMTEEKIAKYSSDLFEGFNSQIFNAPIDLFVENYLYNEFPELRPFQFASLINIIQSGIVSGTDKNISDLIPKEIFSKSKIYNLVHAFQLKDLYGINLISKFNATKLELDQAIKFYDEYLEYKDDKNPAEEYELLKHWAEDLKLNDFFELVGENQYRQRNNVDGYLDSLEKDPFSINEKDPIKEREMKTFLDGQKEIGLNMAVVMFMADALQFFKNMNKEVIKRIAFEIAMQGANGYSPAEDNYRLNSIPNKSFSGYNILAYYYVSWALALPEVLHEIQLPFEEEYKLALTMFKPK
jgi:tetratricopeptide (TPR) repeat protein